mmetsp:Transcript_34465/g.112215  ORF Transcript_34465/g.112215 Transcript_34465/m.112215 type:complete len:102 (+) Transcript_34465:3177-3482(+)
MNFFFSSRVLSCPAAGAAAGAAAALGAAGAAAGATAGAAAAFAAAGAAAAFAAAGAAAFGAAAALEAALLDIAAAADGGERDSYGVVLRCSCQAVRLRKRG